MAGGIFYGSAVWDPALIIAQIIAIQSLFYISLGFLLLLTLGPLSPKLSLFYFFDYAAVSAHSLMGWLVVAAHLLNAAVGAGYLSLVVERAKKCLDFTATLYLLHLLFCCAYRGWPRSAEWWLLNGAGLATMAVLGEWLCLRKEMQDIPMTQGLGAQRPQSRDGSRGSMGLALTTLPGRLISAATSAALAGRDGATAPAARDAPAP